MEPIEEKHSIIQSFKDFLHKHKMKRHAKKAGLHLEMGKDLRHKIEKMIDEIHGEIIREGKHKLPHAKLVEHTKFLDDCRENLDLLLKGVSHDEAQTIKFSLAMTLEEAHKRLGKGLVHNSLKVLLKEFGI